MDSRTEPVESPAAPKWVRTLFPAAVLMGLCALAGYHGHQASAQVQWPFFHDAWRDVGMAQSMLDGRYPEDHVLRGEAQWFNPLTAALVAGVSCITGQPAHTADARLGAYVNLLLPISLFLLATALFGPWVAMAAVAFFIGVKPLTHGWEMWDFTLTYSPWLWAPTFAQFLFCATWLLYWRAARCDRWRAYGVAGAAWGLTFLCHTAPAVITGCMLLLLSVWDAAGRWRADGRPALTTTVAKRFLLPAGVAFVVGLPYTLPILWRYQFRLVRKDFPSLVIPELELSYLPELLRQLATPVNAVALLGLALLLFGRNQRGIGRRILLSWLAVATAFLAWAYLGQLAQRRGIRLQQIVPAHHFLISLTAIRALLVGYGAVRALQAGFAAIRWLLSRSPRFRGARALSRAWDPCLAGTAATLVICLILFPDYAQRDQFVAMRDFGWHTKSFEDRIAACHWILENCSPDDVFLCDEQVAARIVGPAARKTVCTIDIFSNPYVPHKPRLRDKFALYEALQNRDEPAFRELAAKYSLTHVLARSAKTLDSEHHSIRELTIEDIEALALPFLDQAYSAHGLAIYRVRS